MHYPIRFIVCTYNLWNDQRWPDRQESLKQFLANHHPDLLCLQELRPVTRDFIDTLLTNHRRVDDPFGGWARESNIYWNAQLFDLIEYGTEDIGTLEELRRLFWVRLRFRGADDSPVLFVSTAHFTWPGNETEKATNVNPRVAQAGKTLQALDALAPLPQSLLFMGDLNDFRHPLRVLREGGLADSFAALGRNPLPTWPAVPAAAGPATTLDWILHRGPLRPMTSDVVDFYVGDLAPSDHKPVLVTYRFSDER